MMKLRQLGKWIKSKFSKELVYSDFLVQYLRPVTTVHLNDPRVKTPRKFVRKITIDVTVKLLAQYSRSIKFLAEFKDLDGKSHQKEFLVYGGKEMSPQSYSHKYRKRVNKIVNDLYNETHSEHDLLLAIDSHENLRRNKIIEAKLKVFNFDDTDNVVNSMNDSNLKDFKFDYWLFDYGSELDSDDNEILYIRYGNHYAIDGEDILGRIVQKKLNVDKFGIKKYRKNVAKLFILNAIKDGKTFNNVENLLASLKPKEINIEFLDFKFRGYDIYVMLVTDEDKNTDFAKHITDETTIESFEVTMRELWEQSLSDEKKAGIKDLDVVYEKSPYISKIYHTLVKLKENLVQAIDNPINENIDISNFSDSKEYAKCITPMMKPKEDAECITPIIKLTIQRLEYKGVKFSVPVNHLESDEPFDFQTILNEDVTNKVFDMKMFEVWKSEALKKDGINNGNVRLIFNKTPKVIRAHYTLLAIQKEVYKINNEK